VKLATYVSNNTSHAAVLDGDTLYDLGVADLAPLLGLPFAELERRATEARSGSGRSVSEVRLARPVRGTKFIGVGLNYRDHAAEQNARLPANPILFAKFDTSLVGPDEDIRYPAITSQLDYEAELGVVIGKPGRDISLENAMQHVVGYTIVNDVTARDIQLADRQWVRGKTPDAITPVGPVIVTADEIADPGQLGIRLRINGETFQDSSTSELIFGVPELVSFISQDFTLEPGDLIATGTPAGVGFVREPAVFLKRGDTVEVEIDGLGILRNRVA
jgi:2-keto-4-pentenoate hydratase/2-oxohepta-3-ene-1,7-dioic acid hydratase in catechol pathway